MRTHAAAYLGNGGFQLAGCVDPDESVRRAFAARWSVAASAPSIEEFAPDEFDVISICSPTWSHAGDVEAALELRPRLLFCEKPVTESVRTTEELVARCAAHGVLLGVNYTRRWAPDVVELAHGLHAGHWGAVRSAVGTYTKGVLHNGGHMVDLLQMLLGPLELVATGMPVNDFWDDDPSVPAILRSGDGVSVQMALGDARDYALFEVVLTTERGEIVMRDGGLSWTVRRPQPSLAFAGYTTLGAPEHTSGRYYEAMPAAVANIAAALDHGAALASTGQSALAAQRLCEQMRDASKYHA